MGETDDGISFFEKFVFQRWTSPFPSGKVGITSFENIIDCRSKVRHVIDVVTGYAPY